VVDSPGWWLSILGFITGLFNAIMVLVRTLVDPNAAQSYVEQGQRRRPPDRGPGGGGPGGSGGSRIVGFADMKGMGAPRESTG
jgi:hypothetical protein